MQARETASPTQIAIFVFGVFALVAGFFPHSGTVRRLHVASNVSVPREAGTFLENGVYPTTDVSGLPTGIAAYGSYAGSDAFQGDHRGRWFKARSRISVAVAGYPDAPGNRLELEVVKKDGSTQRIGFRGDAPREAWMPWTLRLPKDAEAVRVVASDHSSSPGGWLGFSEPWAGKPVAGTLAWSWLRLACFTCLMLTLLYAPGLIWLRDRNGEQGDFALAFLIGPLGMAALGLACWLAGAWLNPATLARAGVAAALGWIVWQERRRSALATLAAEARTMLHVGALLVGFAVALANVSYGPKGEMLGNTVSRTLEVGGHPDSRISFHVVQLVANHLGPFGPQATHLFLPYSFASRGPLAGLVAAPAVLASGAEVPVGMPDQAWAPFDRQGFAVYRIALIVLASLTSWVVYGVVAFLSGSRGDSPASTGGSRWGLLAASCLQLSPFFVHETYFTWPKLIAASSVLAGWLLARRARPLAAGLALAVGYLFHPLAILSAPVLLMWAQPQPSTNRVLALVRPGLAMLLGIALLTVPWILLGRPAAEGGAQGSFVHYFIYADNAPATWVTWFDSRWQNFADTFLPLHMLLGDLGHESLNVLNGRSDEWIHVGFLSWNTLPFALGLPTFIVFSWTFLVALRRFPWVAVTTFAGPALFLVLYWGAACTGLMRHAGHVLFLTFVALCVWTLSRSEDRWTHGATAWLSSWLYLGLRGADVFWFCLGRALHDHWPSLGQRHGSNDWASLGMASLLLVLAVLRQGAGLKRFGTLRPAEAESALVSRVSSPKLVKTGGNAKMQRSLPTTLAHHMDRGLWLQHDVGDTQADQLGNSETRCESNVEHRAVSHSVARADSEAARTAGISWCVRQGASFSVLLFMGIARRACICCTHDGTRYSTNRANDRIAASRALRVRAELPRADSRSSRNARTSGTLNCVFRTDAITDSDRTRSLVPIGPDQ